MSFYIDKIRIPVVEPNFVFNTRRSNQKIDRLIGKPVIIVDNDQLETFTYNSFFPAIYGTYCDTTNIDEPNTYVKKIKKLKENKNIVRVKLPDMRTNKLYVIDEFNYQPADRLGSIAYTIQMTEYNPPNEVEDEKQIIPNTLLLGEYRQVQTIENQEYTVQQNDCLYDIARRFNMRFIDLYNDNKTIIGNDPNNLIVGQKLKIRGS